MSRLQGYSCCRRGDAPISDAGAIQGQIAIAAPGRGILKPLTNDLFRALLDQIINMKHELVQLAGKIDWSWLDGEIAPLYSDKGRPGIEPGSCSVCCCSEAVCERWIYDPYFQYFTGEEFFRSSSTCSRMSART
jgi:hypothetical protein